MTPEEKKQLEDRVTYLEQRLAQFIYPDRYQFERPIELGVTSWIGRSPTTSFLGFFGATPIIQPTSTGEGTGMFQNSGTAVNNNSTFTGNLGSTAYTILDVVKHLKQLGFLAQ
jgi:hypothetical protein